VVLSLVNFCTSWKWACKTRRWGPRPRWDQDRRFSVPDETETIPNFLESEMFQHSVSRPRLHTWLVCGLQNFIQDCIKGQ